MRPARFVLLTGITSLVLSAVSPLLSALGLRYGQEGGYWDLATGLPVFPPQNPWLFALLAVAGGESTNLLYLGVLSLMLYTIWRDERAEWTVAASSSVRLALIFVLIGLVAKFFAVALLIPLEPVGQAPYLRYDFFATASANFVIFGMTLWLHGLASNQIPKLLELAVVRRFESGGTGMILFWIGFLLTLALYPGSYMSTGVDRTPELLGYWLGSSIGYPLMLISYSLLSMSYLAKKELAARSEVGDALP